MGRWWRPVGSWLSRKTMIALVGVLVVTGGFVFGLNRLDFATGQDSYIDPASQVAKDNREYQDLFGGENMVVLFSVPEGKTVADFLSSANMAQMDEAEAALNAGQPGSPVRSVVSPVALLQWSHTMIADGVALEILGRATQRDPDEASKALRDTDGLITALRLGAAGEQSLDNPDWVAFLLFDNTGFSLDADNALVSPPAAEMMVRKPLRAFIPDNRHAIFAAVLQGNAPLDALAEGSSAVQDAFAGREFTDATVTITGTPTFLTDINDYLQGGMLTLGGIAVLVMMAILVIAFKVRWRLLPLLGMVVGVLWGFGAFGFSGTMLSLVTIAGLPILIGLGIEFSIQVQNRVEEERALEHDRDPFGETLHHMGPPLLAATVAAVIAFLTVKISKVPMVQDFGVLLSLGIVALLAAGIIVPLAILGWRERRWPTTKDPRPGWVEATVRTLGALPRWAVLPLVLIAVVVPVVGLSLETGSRIESDPINWADPSSASIKNARTLEHEAGFASTLGVFVKADPEVDGNGVFTDQMGAFQFDLVEQSLASEEGVLVEASSLVTTVGWLMEVPGATPLPPTGLDLLQAYQAAPRSLQQLMVSEDGNAANVLFQVGPSSLEERSVVLDEVGALIADPGDGASLPRNASATPGGLAVVGVGLLENITANRAELTIVALVLVGAFLVLRYRDLARGLLTMIPVLLAVGTSAALVRLLDITLSPLTTVGGPLVVATCAEFAVLLVDRYAEERGRGLDPEASTTVAAQRTGRAFFTSALTTLGGFAVLIFSPLPLLADFGMVVTINIAVALLAALVVVPPLVKAADHLGFLAMGEVARTARSRRSQAMAWVAGAALLAGGLVMVQRAVDSDDAVAAAPRMTETGEAPATIPPSTTAAPTTSLAPDATLPPGPAEKPDGLVAGVFYDTLVGVGVDPGMANCAAVNLVTTTPEADLLAMGIASVPRPEAVNALLETAAKQCGVTQEQLDAAATTG